MSLGISAGEFPEDAENVVKQRQNLTPLVLLIIISVTQWLDKKTTLMREKGISSYL
jgi:hypothetical protein